MKKIILVIFTLIFIGNLLACDSSNSMTYEAKRAELIRIVDNVIDPLQEHTFKTYNIAYELSPEFSVKNADREDEILNKLNERHNLLREAITEAEKIIDTSFEEVQMLRDRFMVINYMLDEGINSFIEAFKNDDEEMFKSAMEIIEKVDSDYTDFSKEILAVAQEYKIVPVE